MLPKLLKKQTVLYLTDRGRIKEWYISKTGGYGKRNVYIHTHTCAHTQFISKRFWISIGATISEVEKKGRLKNTFLPLPRPRQRRKECFASQYCLRDTLGLKIWTRALLVFQVVLVIKNLPANAGDMRHGFDPWVRKISWTRAWPPTPVFFPGEFHGQRNLAGYSP